MRENTKSRLIENLLATAFLLFLVFFFWDFEVGDGTQYLGQWGNSKVREAIEIERLPSKFAQPSNTMTLPDGSQPTLLLSTQIKTLPYGSRGGIYKKNNNDHLLAIWCNTCERDVILGVKMVRGEMRIGIPDSALPSLTAQMCVAHGPRHRKGTVNKWITYHRP